MPKSISYSREALRTLQRIDKRTAVRIVQKMEQLATDPASLSNNVKALRGSEDAEGPLMRLRMGDWRVIYRDGLVIAVIRVAPRGSAYV